MAIHKQLPVPRDITGQTFGWVTAIRIVGLDTQNGAVWLCKCRCGKEVVRARRQLISGATVSCGCFFFQKRGGKRDNPAYPVWRSMLQRCRNKNSKSYPNYGGRGIKVCESWKNNFYAFAADMGHKPEGATIERINNDGNYEPSNCRWATTREQTRNYRRNVKLTYRGRTQCVTDWAAELGIGRSLILNRLKMGWPPEAALTIPKQTNHDKRRGARSFHNPRE